jgi:hypothetical protein
MTMQTEIFKSALHSALAATSVADLLARRPALILERVAKGGGATKWHYCPNKSSLGAVEARFLPGSVVSFYFDDRIRNDGYSPAVATAVEAVIVQNGEAVVGTLAEDDTRIDAEIITGPNELAEFLSAVKQGSRVFYGPFPAKDNDGVRAVTLVLPDADGTVRAHPH